MQLICIVFHVHLLNYCLSQSMKQHARLAEQLSMFCLLVYVRTSVESRNILSPSVSVSEDLLARTVMQRRCSYIIVWCTGQEWQEGKKMQVTVKCPIMPSF